MTTQYLNLPISPADTAFGLMAEYDADPHPNKVSLIAGAYRGESGQPWVLPSVREAKSRLTPNQTHEYLDIAGSPGLIKLAQSLTFGTEITTSLDKSLASIQTVSGTGANHMAAHFLARHLHPTRVFIPSPTWINHKSIWATTGIQIQEYPYYEPSTRTVDIDGMISVLETAIPNDVVILQTCAHNPTGVDLSRSQWGQVIDVLKRKKLFIVFDSAYQGFATGDIDSDAWAIRYSVDQLILNSEPDHPGLCVAQSFSKNFGLYGERVGALHLVVPRYLSAEGARSELIALARTEYSNPPRFGASIVEMVWGDEGLRSQWERDLETMSVRIKMMRRELRRRLDDSGVSGDWSHIESQIGMFSYTGLSGEQVSRLREEFHASICGLNGGNVGYVARAIGEVVGSGF
ncbi:aspartate transaminase [Aspergillus sclerotioniger CBS 115572]|uniref:Aspartate aminotransferase n=1 Tax=Aspergillus sclerotioniger CBS 115572 TaxID=1450535 RepID=A0A317VT55_9EURO|nr:aspartate transaminase [Aspergillus sclerotioniger CBS 115572]PWY76018.1 aspartate transaminase [Aspergillus sclerotioniger CBS 115572]